MPGKAAVRAPGEGAPKAPTAPATRPCRAPARPRPALPLALVMAAAAVLVAAPPAFGGVLTPESGGSPNADHINTLYIVTLAIGVVIFAGVEGALVYSLVRYRFRRGGPGAAQIRGNTRLEIGWTVGATALVSVLALLTFLYLGDITEPKPSTPGEPASTAGTPPASAAGPPPAAAGQPPIPHGGRTLEIGVNGQQYIWRYDYPGPVPLFSYHEMVVPVHTMVSLKITSQDVVHSWWIPKLGGKRDAVPGHVSETWFRATKPGLYTGTCAELCGEGHADMRAAVRAVPVEEYTAWAATQSAGIREAQIGLAASRRAAEISGQ